jgi:uncharacterized protein (DUF983 family)
MTVARAWLALRRALGLRCPRCGGAPLFDGLVRMRPRCGACGLVFERETGYFIGAIYINYAVTVGLALAGYFALEAWWAPPVGWQVGLWSLFVVLFPLWSFRYSKALWLGLDHLVDPAESGGARGRAVGPPRAP